MNASTITAIATPSGKGGIGIIKISGKEALSIATALFRKRGRAADSKVPSADLLETHKIYYGHIIDAEGGQIVDEVLLSVMKAPRSYTREDVVEINAHGGFVVQQKILELVISKGARLAEPGEFTKRAFLNGRIDLTQAEGVIDIINARTDKALEIAIEQVKGGLGERITSVRDSLVGIVAEIEAGIDFPDDVGETGLAESLRKQLKRKVLNPLGVLLSQYRATHFYREGVKLAVVGRPNVGKSSLVNRLLQKERVIVTPIPGTTRDVIEESLDIHGIPVTVTDTAGLHLTEDPIETIGIGKTQECIRNADLVFFLVDAGTTLSGEDFEIYNTIEKKPAILVINKMDLLSEEKCFPIPELWKIPTVMISALYGQGIDTLKERFADTFMGNGERTDSDRMVPNLRHKISLERGFEAVESGIKAVSANLPEELIAIDLKEGIDALGEITGQSLNKENILDEIFSRFCIGK